MDILGLHDRIIDLSIFYLNPADHIIVLQKKFLIVRQKRLVFRIRHHFLCFICILDSFNQFIIDFCLLFGVHMIADQEKSAHRKNSRKHRNDYHISLSFHHYRSISFLFGGVRSLQYSG